jgi:hypothetical protein
MLRLQEVPWWFLSAVTQFISDRKLVGLHLGSGGHVEIGFKWVRDADNAEKDCTELWRFWMQSGGFGAWGMLAGLMGRGKTGLVMGALSRMLDLHTGGGFFRMDVVYHQ